MSVEVTIIPDFVTSLKSWSVPDEPVSVLAIGDGDPERIGSAVLRVEEGALRASITLDSAHADLLDSSDMVTWPFRFGASGRFLQWEEREGEIDVKKVEVCAVTIG